MDINATLLGQMITFAIFVWFTMKFVWPLLSQAITDRQQTIQDGLAAAERGQRELTLAQDRVKALLVEAKNESAEILKQAKSRSSQLVDEAKQQARVEGERLLTAAKADIAQEILAAKRQLQAEIAEISMEGARRILQRNIDAAANKDIIDQIISEV